MAGSRTVTIANGATVSSATDLADNSLVGIVMPAAFTGTALTFQASADGATYNVLYDKTGSAYSVVVGTSRYIYLPPADFAGVRHVKVVSGSAEGAARSIGLVVRPV